MSHFLKLDKIRQGLTPSKPTKATKQNIHLISKP